MRIFVCIKQVPDTAENIAIQGGVGIDESVKWVMNPYDEYAVEEAIRLKESVGDGEVIVISVGSGSTMSTIRTAIAMGADRGVLITTDEKPDQRVIAKAIAKIIQDEEDGDLVFCGKQSADSEGMQTPFRIAALLDMPVTTNVIAFENSEETVVVESEVEGGARQVIEMKKPCVVAATKGLNEPRYPKLPAIMKAKKKEVKEIALDSLNLDSQTNSMSIVELSYPPEKPEGKMVSGESPQELAQNLVSLLKEEAKVL